MHAAVLLIECIAPLSCCGQVAFSSFTDFGVYMAMAVALHNIPEGLIVAGEHLNHERVSCSHSLRVYLLWPNVSLARSAHLCCDRQQAAGAGHGACIGAL